MGKFGWSYPAGCNGPPDDDYDDTVCVTCGAALPQSPHPGMWAFYGYCDEECGRGDEKARRYVEAEQEAARDN